MPENSAHIEQAKHNKKFLDTIESTTFYDWITTVIFYTALHYTDSFLAAKGVHPLDHSDRLDRVRKGFSKEYYISYKRLYDNSGHARYRPAIWRSTINTARIKLFLDDLQKIRSHS